MRKFIILALLLGAASCKKTPDPITHGQVFSLVSAAATSTSPAIGQRCILYTDTASARLDSCTVVRGSPPVVTPPAPPPPPPAPAPAPPPPPPVGDTVIKTVKAGPNPFTVAVGKTYQLVGGAYNAAGVLIPGAGKWYSDNPAIATVDSKGLVTGVAPGTVYNIEFQYGTMHAWAGVTVTGSVPVPPPTALGIATADSFTHSVGVGAHFSYFDLLPYGNGVAKTIADVKSLGVYFIRDGASYNTNKDWSNTVYNNMKATGLKFLLVTQPDAQGNYSAAKAIDTAVARLGAGNILAFEGPNEVDNNNGYWGGIPAYGANVKTFQCANYAKIHALGLLLTSPTVTSSFGASYMPDISGCSDGNTLHPYPGGALPMSSFSGTSAYTKTFAGNKPQWITETGYHTNVNGTVNHWQPGVSEAAAAKYIPREYLDAFLAGVIHTSTYELIDERQNTGDDEQNFGLFHNDGSPKPSATALTALLQAVRDTGSKAFSPSAYAVTLTGATPTIRSVLLGRRDGSRLLILWNDVSVYNTSAKSDISNPAVSVGITLPTVPQALAVKYPGSSVLQPAKAFTFQVTDAPSVLLITP